jgi:hypothetical protein
VIGKVQEQLQAIYRVSCEEKAENFLLSDEAAQLLGALPNGREALWVVEGDEGLELGLYLQASEMQRLSSSQGSSAHWLVDNLDMYCQVAEGVSHFLYLIRAAEQGRKVSLLELEAQAEIDKFAICLLHRWGDGVEAWSKQLLTRLFEQSSLAPGLGEQEKARYAEASRLSRNYCQSLLPKIARRRLDDLLDALRYSYRLGAEAKLRHLSEA